MLQLEYYVMKGLPDHGESFHKVDEYVVYKSQLDAYVVVIKYKFKNVFGTTIYKQTKALVNLNKSESNCVSQVQDIPYDLYTSKMDH